MAKPSWHTQWKVHPHDPVNKLTDDLWDVEGSLKGIPLKRRMTLMRLRDGRVVVHNAVALEDALMSDIEAWGRPSFLVVPNGYHRLDAAPFRARYPGIIVVAGRGHRKRVSECVPVDGGPELLPAAQGVSAEELDGNKAGEMVFMQTHADGSKTAVLNDAFWNEHHQRGFPGFVLRMIGSTGGPKITRVMKLVGIADKQALKAHLLRIAATPGLARIIMAHGRIIEERAAETLREATERFL